MCTVIGVYKALCNYAYICKAFSRRSNYVAHVYVYTHQEVNTIPEGFCFFVDKSTSTISFDFNDVFLF